MSETMQFTDEEKSRIARAVEISAEDVSSLNDDAKVGTLTGAWFVIHTGDDFGGVVSAVLSDSAVELWKAEREEGFVSAKHKDVIDAEK